MADVASIAVKHQHSDISPLIPVWRANVECRQFLIVRCWDHQLLEISHSELGGPGDLVAGVIRDMGGVDKSSIEAGQQDSGKDGSLGKVAHFCLKYNSELSTAATPWRHSKYAFIIGAIASI